MGTTCVHVHGYNKDNGPMYQIVEDSSIRGKNKLYSNFGFPTPLRTFKMSMSVRTYEK